MAVLTANHVSQSFGAEDIFSGLSASIPQDGKIGLVGPNGVGKTTFLRILAGLATPSAGSVHLAKQAVMGYLSQEASETFTLHEHSVYDEMLTVFAELREDEATLRELEAKMADGRLHDDLLAEYSQLQERFEAQGGYQYPVRIKQVLTGLGFNDENWHLPLTQLSGGQKTRVRLAKLLLESPDLLILDEPTNHLDVEAIEWLEGTLGAWDGAILVVSHDRYFLDRFANTIWELHPDRIESYRGNYSAYVRQRTERWERLHTEYDSLMEHIYKEMDFIRKNIASQRTQMAQGKLSRLAREVELVHAGGISAWRSLNSKGWAQLSSELDVLRPAERVGDLQQRIDAIRRPTRPAELHLRLEPEMRSGELVLQAEEAVIGYPDAPLFRISQALLIRQECLALIGPNGAGKSTFLKTLLGDLDLLGGTLKLGASLQIGYFSQAHEELERENTVLDELLRHENMGIAAARSYLAQFLFRGDDVYKRVDMLSGGERGRLSLAVLCLQKANFLLLDEPTNHLDIPSQEALQEVLENYEGTILMVSHDRYLIDRLATQIWAVDADNGRLHIHTANYQSYLKWRDEEHAKQKVVVQEMVKETAVEPTSNGKPKLSKNEQRRREKAIAKVEEEIETAEEALLTLTSQLEEATQSQSFDKIQRISIEYAETESRIETLLNKWEKLSNE